MFNHVLDRRTGGLERADKLATALHGLDRRTGGLERNGV